ncbi:L,D-transpeptidase family protein [Janibacter sp. GXQ6167]|uniref:L,D-transpeptidase family protein n=1 Tax=Janibacter sp. GXQ6167 TaxID=3240791 RepID=UPI00352509CE
MKTRTKVLVATALAIPLALGAGAGAYASHYQDRALPRTYVGDLDVSGLTRAEVAEAIRERAAETTIEVKGPTGSKKASLADVGYTIDIDATVDQVLSSHDLGSYARAPFNDRTITTVATQDEQALSTFVSGLVQEDVAVAKDATVVLAKDKQTFRVKPATTGRAADPSPVDQAADAAASSLTSGSATVRITTAKPKISTADAKAAADRANAIVAQPVTVTEGTRTFTATTEQKASWISLDQTLSPRFDQTKIATWVTTSANVSPIDGARDVTSTGKVLKVVTEARDGVSVTNADALAKDIAEDLGADHASAVTAQVKATPAKWTERKLAPGAEKLAYPAVDGEKWIDVNLSAHTMSAYVGGKRVYGPIAMVHGAPATPSDIGTFRIFMKNPKMTMRGSNADGSDYETPDVPWSSFYNGGEALHGAYWRSTWGYAASHGCINLPISVAKWVYDFAPIGTPVVVHN